METYNQQDTADSQSTPLPPDLHQKRHYRTYGVITGVFFLFIVAIGAYWGLNYEKQISTDENDLTKSEEVTHVTYENNLYPYTFSYPKTAAVATSSGEGKLIVSSVTPPQKIAEFSSIDDFWVSASTFDEYATEVVKGKCVEHTGSLDCDTHIMATSTFTTESGDKGIRIEAQFSRPLGNSSGEDVPDEKNITYSYTERIFYAFDNDSIVSEGFGFGFNVSNYPLLLLTAYDVTLTEAIAKSVNLQNN